MPAKTDDKKEECVKVLSLDGHVITIDDAGCRILEIDDPKKLIGRSWIELWAGAELHIAKAAVIRAARGEAVTFEAFGYTMKGRGRFWESEVTPMMGPDGKPQRLRVVSRDITDRRPPHQPQQP